MLDIPVTEFTDESKENVGLNELADDSASGPGKPGKPGRKPFWTVELVKPALIKANGIITDAARILSDAYHRPCARETISKLVNSTPELREVCREAQAAIQEEIYAARVAMAKAGDERAQEFLLKALDPRFRTKQEISDSDGGPIQLVDELVPRLGDNVFEGIDDALLTNDEKIELAGMANIVDHFGSMNALSLKDFARMKELQAKAQRQQPGRECLE
jgi:hypothetical protein